MSAPSFQAKRFALLDLANADEAVTGADFKVLYCLLSIANGTTGRCYPGRRTVAVRTGLSDSGAKKALKHLRALGYVDVLIEATGRGHANELGFGFEKLAGNIAERGYASDPFRQDKGVTRSAKGVTNDAERGHPSDPHLNQELTRQEGTPYGASPSVSGLKVEDRAPVALERAGSSSPYQNEDEAPFNSTVEEMSAEEMAEREAQIEREEEILAALRAGRSHLRDGSKVVPPAPSGRASSLLDNDYARAYWIGRFVPSVLARPAEERRAWKNREIDKIRTLLQREGRTSDEVNAAFLQIGDELAVEFRARTVEPSAAAHGEAR